MFLKFLSAAALFLPALVAANNNSSGVPAPDKDGKYWIINGTKKWITNGTFSD